MHGQLLLKGRGSALPALAGRKDGASEKRPGWYTRGRVQTEQNGPRLNSIAARDGLSPRRKVVRVQKSDATRRHGKKSRTFRSGIFHSWADGHIPDLRQADNVIFLAVFRRRR